jgi:hypothetical protein
MEARSSRKDGDCECRKPMEMCPEHRETTRHSPPGRSPPRRRVGTVSKTFQACVFCRMSDRQVTDRRDSIMEIRTNWLHLCAIDGGVGNMVVDSKSGGMSRASNPACVVE